MKPRKPLKPGKGFNPRSKPMNRGTATLTSSKPLQRGDSQLKRPDKPMAPVGARAKRMRQGKVAANAAEADWMARAQQFGCIVCHLQHGTRAPAEIHHLKDGDRRMGHLFSIGLCVAHHRGGDDSGPFISRHPWRNRFEAAYGTEAELLARLQKLLAPPP
jgi:hypothetical protein